MVSHAAFVDVILRSTKHARKPRIQVVRIEVVVRAVWSGGNAVVRAKCPVFIRHGPPNVTSSSRQTQTGPAGGRAEVDPVRPDPALAACRVDFVKLEQRGDVTARCDGLSPKLLTVASGSSGLITTLVGNKGLGSCRWSPDRRSMGCLFPPAAKGKPGTLSVLIDRPFASFTVYVTAGGYNERGTTHVLRQNWWRLDDGSYLCSQTIPRTEQHRCATIASRPGLVTGKPTTTVPG
jgi:hypothetical protein